MATRTVTLTMRVDLPDRDEDALLDWARVTHLRPDFTLEDAYKALVREVTFLGERYARDEDELSQVAFSFSCEDDI